MPQINEIFEKYFKKYFMIFKDPFALGFMALGIIVGVLFFLYSEQAIGWTIFFGFTAFLIPYMIYRDVVLKNEQIAMEERKDENIIGKIHEQREADLGKGRCVSCNTELKPGAEKCPKCGFDLTRITKDAPKVDRIEKDEKE